MDNVKRFGKKRSFSQGTCTSVRQGKEAAVIFPSRSLKTVTCPHCWTEQRSNRNRCYQCGVQFHYGDEGNVADKISS